MSLSGKKLYYFLWLAVAGLPWFFAHGSGIVPANTKIPNPLGAVNDITSFITLLLDTLFPIASIVSIFFLIFSGFLMVTAGGNEEKLSKARQA